jgi:hypothetical protein
MNPLKAYIFKRPASPMQAGRGRSKGWLLEFGANPTLYLEPLMGWTGTRCTQTQVHLHFRTREGAVRYAQKAGLEYTILPAHTFRQPLKSYSANFSRLKFVGR